jgi:hypothetical protein
MKDIRQYEAINPCVVAKDLEDLGIYAVHLHLEI